MTKTYRRNYVILGKSCIVKRYFSDFIFIDLFLEYSMFLYKFVYTVLTLVRAIHHKQQVIQTIISAEATVIYQLSLVNS